ncbi:Dipeptidyl peptidase [Trichinella pseudospiralis]
MPLKGQNGTEKAEKKPPSKKFNSIKVLIMRTIDSSPRILAAIFALILSTEADIPVSCYFEDVAGTWKFQESGYSTKGPVQCDNTTMDFNRQNIIQLLYPNVALDKFGNRGKWTLIYNQGFEVIVNNRKYFAFFKWIKRDTKFISICGKTLPGWQHDILGRHWSCFVGTKLHPSIFQATAATLPMNASQIKQQHFKHEYHKMADFVSTINSIQSNWTAKVYDEQFYLNRMESLIRANAYQYHHTAKKIKSAPITTEQKLSAVILPEKFDWRNINGNNFIGDVRDQRNCGSCYAFASASMLEARYHILTQNRERVTFSPQDVVNCSPYSQGCDGGFSYLIAGKYAEDYGMVSERCVAYTGKQQQCRTPSTCERYYATDYEYIGGYYGASNEILMMQALVKNGPIAVGFEVHDDFFSYSHGIYHHSNARSPLKWNPLVEVNHAVIIVGYGADEMTKEKYWIVKNSWGRQFGEDGYFRIRRGTDECGIESIAFQANPIIL